MPILILCCKEIIFLLISKRRLLKLMFPHIYLFMIHVLNLFSCWVWRECFFLIQSNQDAESGFLVVYSRKNLNDMIFRCDTHCNSSTMFILVVTCRKIAILTHLQDVFYRTIIFPYLTKPSKNK